MGPTIDPSLALHAVDVGATPGARRRPRAAARRSSPREARAACSCRTRAEPVDAGPRSRVSSSAPGPAHEARASRRRRRAATGPPAAGGAARSPRARRRTRRRVGHRSAGSRERARKRTARTSSGTRAAGAVDGRHVGVADAQQDVELLAAAEEGAQDEHLGQHDAKGEDVAPRVELAAEHLLGRHVAELALELPGVGAALDLRRARDAEVGQLDRARAVDEDVAGRHVAVHQRQRLALVVARRVRVLEGAQDRERDVQANVERDLALVERGGGADDPARPSCRRRTPSPCRAPRPARRSRRPGRCSGGRAGRTRAPRRRTWRRSPDRARTAEGCASRRRVFWKPWGPARRATYTSAIPPVAIRRRSS